MKAIFLTAALIGSTLMGTMAAYAAPEDVTYVSTNSTANGSIDIEQYFNIAEGTGNPKPVLTGTYSLSGAPEIKLEKETITNTNTGKLNFEFAHAGVYETTLTITGKVSIPDMHGDTFTKQYDIRAYVKNDGKGGLITDITAENKATGTKAAKICFSICADDPPISKTISGADRTDQFKFHMQRKTAGAPMPAGSSGNEKIVIAGPGAYEFGWMYFEQPGDYDYEVYEENDGQANYTYDTTVYTKAVKITDNNGELKISSTYDKGDVASFTNTYTEPSTTPSGGGGTPSGGGGGRRSRPETSNNPPTTPGEVLGATRDAAEDAGRGVLGAVRNPQGQVLGAVRTGDSSAMVTWAVILMLAASGIVGWFNVYQRRKRNI
jgi:pilin isopeptide linkage protein